LTSAAPSLADAVLLGGTAGVFTPSSSSPRH
jgi:hypothetical protein